MAPARPSVPGSSGRARLSTREWRASPHRAELLALYAEADALFAGWSCACSAAGGDPLCCRFDETGREPYPTAVELEELRHAVAGTRRGASSSTSGAPHPKRRSLPIAGPCPLLDSGGRCTVYASRPFGCRTFFCLEAEGPYGARARAPRDTVGSIARRIADLSARFDPRDPHPRSLSRALVGSGG